MIIICLLILFVLGVTASVIIVQSSLSTTILTSGHTVSYAGSLNTNYPGFLGTGTDWIWDQYGDLSPKGTKITF